jgi:hypothetical protein
MKNDPKMDAGINRSLLQWRAFLSFVVLLMLSAGSAARAQSNFAFWVGGTGVYYDHNDINWGTSVGVTAKFNVTRLLLLRTQFNVDRIHMQDVDFEDFDGDQTVTFVCFGLGPEIAYGGRDFNVFTHLTVHSTIRTMSRILTDEENRESVWELTRASVGLIGAVGFEAFITDNIGLEGQGQYDIYSFDHTPGIDPRYIGLRAIVGVQFYLGRNFAR